MLPGYSQLLLWRLEHLLKYPKLAVNLADVPKTNLKHPKLDTQWLKNEFQNEGKPKCLKKPLLRSSLNTRKTYAQPLSGTETLLPGDIST